MKLKSHQAACQNLNNKNSIIMISKYAKIGSNVEIGKYVIIEDGVEIGDNTVIKNFVELRKNTKVGSNCYIDSRVSTSGECIIANNVTLRYDSIIAMGCEIGDGTYVCPRVMTNNLDSGKDQIGGAKVGKNCFIGTNSVLHHGIKIGDNSVTGSMAFVNKDIPDNEIWIGSPAKFFKSI